MPQLRYKATKQQKRYKRAALPKDYAVMLAAASAVVIENRGMQYRSGEPEYVLFEFPHWVTFAKDFPKGHIVEKTSLTNVYKINAVKLLNWLYKEGYSGYDASMLVKETRQFEVLDGEIDRMFEDN